MTELVWFWFVTGWTAFVAVGCITHNAIQTRKPSKMLPPKKEPKQGTRDFTHYQPPGVYKDSVGKELAIPKEPVKSYELYGHPAPPILVLSASLPSAPIGYGWELTTAINTEGNPALRLAMLDLKTTTVIDAIEGDLVVIRRWKYAKADTYADFYRRAEEQERAKITGYERDPFDHGISSYLRDRRPIYGADPAKLLGKVMLANLITPMVDWASLLVLRYIVEHPDETKVNYILLESNEEANA